MIGQAPAGKPYGTGIRLGRYCRIAAFCAGSALAGMLTVQPALALSEIKREELPAPAQTTPPADGGTVPVPDGAAPPAVEPGTTAPVAPDATEPGGEGTDQPDGTAQPDSAAPNDAAPDDAAPPSDESGEPQTDANEPIPEVQYDASQLPAPVKALRDQLLEAAKSGDIQKLRPLIGQGDEQAQLSLAGIDGDPIDYLKSLAGDEDGQEILAILEEVLTAGYVHLDPGTDEELYVWPYFFAVPLDKLTGPQRVELFKLVTAGDYEEMKTYGSYIFYRVGITPQGRWAFFVAGE
jgi:hypothetical protein